jgi:prepilin-type N-terminal cleavage/methylation domain-containing protein
MFLEVCVVKRKKQLKGFTLIECLVAVLLLLVSFAGGIAMYFHADRLVGLVVHKHIALALANWKMEELKGGDYPPLSSVETDLEIVEGGLQADRVVSVGNEINGYREVSVNVTWTEPSEEGSTNRMVSAMTYLAP